MPTKEDLLFHLEALETAVNDWRKVSSQHPRDPIGEAVIDAIEELVNLCYSQDFPEDVWHTVLAVDKFHAEFERWAEEWNARAPGAMPHGNSRLWFAYDQMLLAREPLPVRGIETPEQLEKQKVYPNFPAQVAKIYGWYDASGEPDVKKVHEEYANPGRHFNKDNFVNPADAALKQQVAEQWQEREKTLHRKHEGQNPPEPPEAIDELIFQGLTIPQIQRIHINATERKICDVAEEYGLKIAGEGPQVSPRDSLRERHLAEERDRQQEELEAERLSQVDSHPEIADMEQRIIAIAEDGLKPLEIAKVLEKDYPDLTYHKCGRVLKKHREQSIAATEQ